jgi:hypothetical protein
MIISTLAKKKLRILNYLTILDEMGNNIKLDSQNIIHLVQFGIARQKEISRQQKLLNSNKVSDKKKQIIGNGINTLSRPITFGNVSWTQK